MITRRTAFTALAGATVLLPADIRAQDNYPARSVTILVGFAPGGGTDIIARLLAPSLQAEFGQAVAVENRAGASGTLAAAAVARSRPDGYTLLMGTVSTQAVVAPLMRNPPYDQDSDFTPIALAGTVPLVAVVPANAPYQDLKGLIEFARQNPGKLNYASSGIATQQHLAAEMLCQAAGVQMTHVPYRGTGPVLNDLMAGTLDLAIDTLPTHLPHLRSGGTRALAVTTAQRVHTLPDVPTVAESGFPGYEITVWYMLLGPAGLQPQVTQRCVQAINKALQDTTNRTRLEEAGFMPGGGSAADAADLVRREAARYGALVQRAGIRVD
ncbi:Bug family tripartite tricarboxylate transporter substrate binding protein [Roseomonas marmotae]|uniref:Tripartite tricarboxylate transporter substrate binding protein n=1 Tax=Roseomonas marmotae TaxID=2768161 RepID=A0ABS3KKW9_9PROT|nr:tripartite tricarboxylate transporter substrate binding protein [Roseomonas marmotae]MBO1077238.1 tripartite tricarboxylate transporter substrate binding protein [Roseomonas marmotae]QTI81074.1 tripartite tricarboxylate transporter substrate binding protein [Roseomonas marmotae]